MENLTSCEKQEPFVKLDEGGKASILNYNLPQSTCYDATSFIGLGINPKFFKGGQLRKPGKNYWDLTRKTPVEELIEKLKNNELLIDGVPYMYNPDPIAERIPRREPIVPDSLINPGPVMTLMSTTKTSYETEYYNEIANRIKAGYYPVKKRLFSGIDHIVYLKEPAKAKPQITMVLHLKMCSFLGNYGAGRTVKTFSLLPGERTNISIRTYEHNEVNRSYAQNVMDSFSVESAQDLQSSIEQEMEHASGRTTEETHTETGNWKAGGNAGLDLGFVSFGGGGGGGGTSTDTNSVNEAVSTQINVLVNSTSRHTAKSNSSREIDVNTSTTANEVSESERTITRELENINRSRVLNFVFRQLLQEFISITYLHDVSFIYSNGYPSQRKSCKLSGLDSMLSQVLVANKVEGVKNKIYTQLCSIVDYRGEEHSLIEKVTEKFSNCINPDAGIENKHYVRVRKGLKQEYNGREVKGIIMDVTSRILRTPSLVVDALLGQGEALDCYNMKLQEAATVQAVLANNGKQQAIDIINGIEDPKERATLYKRVFGDCCEKVDCNCSENDED